MIVDPRLGMVGAKGELIDLSEGGCQLRLHRRVHAHLAGRVRIDLAGKILSLNDFVRSGLAVRRAPNAIAVYKSVGSALQDVVIAEMLLRRARSAGRYAALPPIVKTINK